VIDNIALVFIGILIGTLVPFVAGWVTFDRWLHELMLEARSMQSETAELRKLSKALSEELKRRGGTDESAQAGQIFEALPTSSVSLDDAIFSVSIEREMAGLVRPLPRIQASYFQGR
jgi:hypothetical protein